MKITIDTSNGKSGVRLILRGLNDETELLPDEAYHSAWYYIPAGIDVINWWSIMDWKSAYVRPDGSGSSDPVYSLNIIDNPDGSYHARIYDHVGDDGRYNSPPGLGFVARSDTTWPTDEWTHLECYYRWSMNPDGRITCWINGELAWDLQGIVTEFDYTLVGYENRDIGRRWKINHYSDGLSPSQVSIYVDDAAVADGRIWPGSQQAVCGDGTIDPDEECDDGDTNNGDGCSASCSVEVGYTCSGEPSVCVPNPTVLWSTSHESGDVTSAWEGGGMSGGIYNSGGVVTATTEAAHTGDYSARMRVQGIDSSEQGARLHKHPYTNDGYFSTWYMFPEIPQVNSWSNIMQWKLTCGGSSTPTWFMHIYSTASDRQSGELGFKEWKQSSTPPNAKPNRPTINAGEWFHMEAYYKVGTNDGIIRIWIDGELYWDLQNINTQRNNGGSGSCDDIIRSWGPTLYGENWYPGDVISYVDDAAVSSGRIGPGS
jgi:cysteine-rich repeat protein